jgi:hypothetical protein
MKDNRAFWDTSAIVPLCVHENHSARARQTLRRYPRPVVWWGTLAEACSAFARALRVGEITIKEKKHAIHHLGRLSGFWKEIAPGQTLRELSIQLLDNHSLRTGDALQLAAALVWCEEKPRRQVFVCFDNRLATVAEDVGFNVIKA